MRSKLDKETLKQIKEDLKLYFDFLELYNKPRERLLQSQIDEFVKKESSIIRRIRFIEDLERKESRTNKANKKTEDDFLTIPSKDKKKILRKNSLFNFIFGEKKLVKDFGERTKTLIIKFLGFFRSPTPESNVEWMKYKTEIEATLFKPFSFIVSNGWRYMDRIHYNVCVAFATFINSFVKNSMPIRNTKTDDLIMLFEECLPYYLQVVTREEYRQILAEAIVDTLPHISVFDNVRLIQPLIEDLIDVSPTKTSFINIILSIYILHYKRNITLQDLCKQFRLPPINANKYNLHKTLLPSVSEEVKKAKEKYNHANRDLFFIKPVDQSLSFDSDRQNATVRAFNRLCVANRDIATIDSADNPSQSNPFAYIRDDLVGVMIRFLSGFILTYGDILSDLIYVKSQEERKKISIFDKNLFKILLNSMEETVRNYENMKLASEFSTITLKTYKNYLEKIRSSSDKEDKLCLYTKTALETLCKMRDMLNEVLYNHFLAGSLTGKELLEAQKVKDIPITDIEENVPRFLPYFHDAIIINRYHDGKTILSVVNEIVNIIANIAYLFEEPQTLEMLSKEEELLLKCEEALLTISKTA